MTIMTVVLCVIALGLGAIVGWVVASARRGAVLIERDLARAEREKSDAARVVMQRRLEEAQQARAIAESQLGNLRQIEDTFAGLAQKAFREVSEALATSNRTQVSGALETKRAEIDALLTPVREMLEQYRGEVVKSEHARNESYGGLQEQIRMLLAAQESTQREASRLANALQSP